MTCQNFVCYSKSLDNQEPIIDLLVTQVSKKRVTWITANLLKEFFSRYNINGVAVIVAQVKIFDDS